MKDSDSPNLSDHDRHAFRRPFEVIVATFAVGVSLVGVLLFPVTLGRWVAPDGDYSRISDIGQAYGAASAVISALALGMVVLGQSRQAGRARARDLSRMNDELVQLAMDEPAYRQCWGARMAPEDVDEALFYYCNRVLKSWKIAWELRDLSETQARAYLRSFFQSEVPRLFWCQHGQWQMRGTGPASLDAAVSSVDLAEEVTPLLLGEGERNIGALRIAHTDHVAEAGYLDAVVVADATGAPMPNGSGCLGHD